ncbi:aminotransferase class I/II-fold pyridoxal phosphate-dependent enzyme [Leptolyngbya sp. FACHB-711]|uniref:aminotransferase class I/II-fold pyridoxal phosphate-dependent enzyme n=1 Tax=Leptolyngbya sp. FACHB-711 TaxID=2692813 RepID=UPI00321FBCC7
MPLEPIAIIGLGCRYPGANHPEAFWQLMQAGKDAVTEVPPDRWDVQQFYSPELSEPGKTNTRWGGFLEQIDRFDPQFFGIAPREVATMDPQQRLLLEVAWEALEDGGQVPEQLRGSETGVFIGIGTHDYSIMLWQQPINDPYATTGTGNCIAANRISYLFDFKGPSLAIDTACSSSLVAVHLACQSLWTGESTLALAGGVNVLILPTVTIGFSKGGFMSSSGRCKSFDASADGYVRSEGAGIVVLKPLSQALADRDPIYATIRGSAVNQDGFSQGMAAPNPTAQEAVLRSAYRRAGVSPAAVQYVEAHGTGTKLGDPIELQALSAVLTKGRAMNQPCAIGSVKSNIGHTETAAGVAGLIKVALAIKHGQIPPSLHFKTPNPQIPFDRLPLRVQTELTSWSSELPLLAGVNSFGFGGTNAHVVVEAAPSASLSPANSGSAQRPLHLLTLSAKTEKALRDLSQRYAQWIADRSDVDLANLCYTANAKRSRFSHRLAVMTESLSQLQQQLAAFSRQQPVAGVSYATASPAPLAFLFTGQGSQYGGMGRQLYETEPVFRAAIDRCGVILQSELDRLPARKNGFVSLRSLLYEEDFADLLNQTAYTQLAIFALEYALAQLWLSWGIEPHAVMGHSVGEYVAACVAGVFCLEDGLRLIAARGRLMQALPLNGRMISVAAEASTVRSLMQSVCGSESVSIAAINGPQSTVISGEQEAIDLLAIEFELQGIKTTRLKVSHAFHSPLMEPMIAQFCQVAETIVYHPPHRAIVSNVTGRLVGAEIATPDYWCEHIRQPVQFAAGLATLYQQNYRTFLEIGAKPILCGMGRTCVSSSDVQWLPSLDPRQSDWTVLLLSLGAIAAMGFSVNWAAFDRAEERQVLHLPTYPFQRQRYWWDEAVLPGTFQPQSQNDYRYEELQNQRLGSPHDGEARGTNRADNADNADNVNFVHPKCNHPLLGQLLSANSAEARFAATIAPHQPDYLQDHRIANQIIFPAAGYVEIALAAAAQTLSGGQICIESLAIEQPLLFPAGDAGGKVEIQTIVLSDESGNGKRFQICSGNSALQPGDRQRYATGKIRAVQQAEKLNRSLQFWQDIQQLQQREGLSSNTYYQQLRQQHLHYGKSFQAIQQLWQQQNVAWSRIQLPAGLDASPYSLHPVVWDACFQTVGAAVAQVRSTLNLSVYLPVGIDRLTLARSIDRILESPLNSSGLNSSGLNSPGLEGFERQPHRLGFPQNGFDREANAPSHTDFHTELSQNLASDRSIWCRVELQAADLAPSKTNQSRPHSLKANLMLFSAIGENLATIEGLTLQAVSDTTLQKLLQVPHKSDESQNWLYELVWQPQDHHALELTRSGDRLWIIFADDRGVGEKLADLLKQQGDRSVLVWAGDGNRRIKADQYAIDPACPEQFQQLMRELGPANSIGSCGIVHLWSLNGSCSGSPSGQPWLDEQAMGCGTALNLLQAMPSRSRLWLITQATQAIPDSSPSGSMDSHSIGLNAAHSSLWGLARTIRLEQPELHCTCIDLGSQPSDATLAQLVEELQQPDGEDQIAYRQEQRYVARLVRSIATPTPMPETPLRLGISAYGVLDDLALMPSERRFPQRGEVEIQVLAAGVNFRDVLNALGMLQPVLQEMGYAEAAAVPFGGECVGRIVAVGAGVRDLQMGDEVIAAQALGSLAQFVTVKAQFVILKPKRLTFAEAATLPTTFLTAQYGLQHLAKLKRGQRVLIHAAAGGVGQAAIQIAQQAGATVYATASPGKWDFLRSLGVQHIMNSRTIDFAEMVMHLTDGQGVDVVLNSLSGAFIEPSLSVLAAGGRFVEIGKLGIWTAEQVQQTRSDVVYLPFDLWTVGQENPAVIRSMLKSLLPKFESGKLNPLPHTVFPIEQAADAFRYMAQAKHIGRVVITLPPLSPGQPIVFPNCTYLITGGLGALGLKTAQGLIDHGATHLLLAGRKPPSPEAQQAIEQMQAHGASITIAQVDITRFEAIEQLLLPYQAEHPAPLRGIIHAAGILDDGMLQNLTWTRFVQVMAPKVAGAWHLHQASRSLSLDFFVCFSSIASLFGSPGQGSYAAANAAIDGLMHYRRQLGLPGLSINWGAWAEVGMAARLEERDQQRLAAQGMALIPSDRGITLLETLLRMRSPQKGNCFASAQVGVLPVDWSVFLARQVNVPPFLEAFAQPLLKISSERSVKTLSGMLSGTLSETSSRTFTNPDQELSKSQFINQQSEDIAESVSAVPAAAASEAPRSLEQLQAHLQAELAKVLGFSTADAIGFSDNFADLGMDSLMAVEFNNRLQKTLNCTISSSVLFDYATIAALSAYLLTLLGEDDRVAVQAMPSAAVHRADTVESLAQRNGFIELEQELQTNRSNGSEIASDSGKLSVGGRSNSAYQDAIEQKAIGSVDRSGNGISDTSDNLEIDNLEIHNSRQTSETQSNSNEPRNDTEINAEIAEINVDLESLPVEFYQFAQMPEYINLKHDLARVEQLGNPFFKIYEGIARETTRLNGREFISYASYNYIGMSGDPIVSEAAKAAIDRYGTSVSASRVVAGERPIHRELEQTIARFLGTEDCIVYVGGHATNVTTIGHLLGSRDLILYDALSHNSLREGCNLSGATAIEFAHNDVRSLEQQLIQHRHRYEKVLIVVEGIYSTDGDLAPLPEIVALKQRFKTFLMVDEAHSIGVLGRRGGGIGEHFNIVPNAVDLWMGTLSKSFASCGGYIAGCKALIEYLKYTAPGFVFSVGMSPANTAAALAALQVLQKEPDRVTKLHQRSQLFLQLAQQHQLNTGASHSSPVIPVIVGEPYKAVQLSHLLAERGIDVQPMVYPSVPYHASRLRFFVTCLHSEAQIRYTIEQLAQAIDQLA